jgi:DnaJ-class molecular chaperone
MKNLFTKSTLEKACDECGGTGTDWYDDGQGEPCWKCQGTGHVATEEGKAILQLIAHHSKGILEYA